MNHFVIDNNRKLLFNLRTFYLKMETKNCSRLLDYSILNWALTTRKLYLEDESC